jgi:hypothetical protein
VGDDSVEVPDAVGQRVVDVLADPLVCLGGEAGEGSLVEADSVVELREHEAGSTARRGDDAEVVPLVDDGVVAEIWDPGGGGGAGGDVEDEVVRRAGDVGDDDPFAFVVVGRRRRGQRRGDGEEEAGGVSGTDVGELEPGELIDIGRQGARGELDEGDARGRFERREGDDGGAVELRDDREGGEDDPRRRRGRWRRGRHGSREAEEVGWRESGDRPDGRGEEKPEDPLSESSVVDFTV